MEHPFKRGPYKIYNNKESTVNIPERTKRRWKTKGFFNNNPIRLIRQQAYPVVGNESQNSNYASDEEMVNNIPAHDHTEIYRHNIDNENYREELSMMNFENDSENISNDESLGDSEDNTNDSTSSLNLNAEVNEGNNDSMHSHFDEIGIQNSNSNISNDNAAFDNNNNDNDNNNDDDNNTNNNSLPNLFSTNGYSIETLKNVLILMVTKRRHNLTYEATQDIAKLLNATDNDFNRLLSKHRFQKILKQFSTVLSIHHICNYCNHYAGKQLNIDDEKETLDCQHCKEKVVTKQNIESGKTFLYLSMTQQLREIIETSNDATSYRDERTKQSDYAIEDVFDGKLYRKTLRSSTLEWNNTITLTFGFDGVPIFSSSNYSTHPILCMINELPPKLRRKNIILCSVWCGQDKPCVNEYFKPFVSECKVLREKGFEYINQGLKLTKKCQLIMGICDSVARPSVQCSTQFNGEYGCSQCLHPGKQIEKGNGTARVYPVQVCDNPYGEGIRTHEATEIHAQNKEKGLNGKSILFNVEGFNIVAGLPPDWMHCVALGVCRQLVKIWLNSKNHQKAFYLKTSLERIDSLLLSYKPTLDVSRTPRKLSEYKYWKAYEWVMWLLFYSIPTLKTFLPTAYLRHWCLLVEGIALLLKTSILPSEIYTAENLLVEFVKGVDELYEEENVSFNVHFLTHLSQSVRDWGPLWSHDAFVFEDYNGEIGDSVKSSQGVPVQICNSFRLKYAINRLQYICKENLSNFEQLYVHNGVKKNYRPQVSLEVSNAQLVGSCKVRKLSRQHYLALQRIFVNYDQSNHVQYFSRAYINNELIHTRNYSRAYKRSSYYVLLKDQEIFEIHHFVVINQNRQLLCYAIGQYFDKQNRPIVAGSKISHLITLGEKSEDLTAVNVTEITQKVMYVAMRGLISAIAGIHPNRIDLLT